MNNKKDILFNTVYNACYSDIAENRLRPKFIAKSASLIFRYIYIYIYRKMYIIGIKLEKIKLQNSIQLSMLFLFVEPQFRYPFLPLLAHDNQTLESLFGSPVAGTHGGLTPQMNVMPVVPKKITP